MRATMQRHCKHRQGKATMHQPLVSSLLLLPGISTVFLPVVLSYTPTLPKQFPPTDLHCSIRQLYFSDKGIFGVPGFRGHRCMSFGVSRLNEGIAMLHGFGIREKERERV